ncbi:hypothetical protein [Rhodoferax fermentans]|uniref:Uncharacterized protein n=1 Tax=Rhodoferax fermentans TaxID=28066 RepID=A0A1T1AVU8_RHOFE|nr:hypothetical protein [Rhodoferax fermentans]MBK1685189.1 hypothetical protein [Rhodoferax fermentans]OOV08177.1 hypothetical protein RF819_16925 [Rhodoferax fermentans]
MSTNEFTPTADSNLFAFGFLEDELETLLALSITLMNRLEDQGEDGDVTSWRLSQVLNERLSSVTFTNNMRVLMLGKKLEVTNV